MQEPTEPRGKRSFARTLRSWTGRPLALGLGWAMSCALVTAVTLTAVNRVGHEVAGSTPRVISQAGASAQASEQSASAASAASVSATADPVTSPATTAPVPTTKATEHPTSRPTHSPLPPPTTAPPSSTAPATTLPSAPISSVQPDSPPASGPPSNTNPVPSGPAGKQVFRVPEGQIVIACDGDLVANASSSVADGYKKSDVFTPSKFDVTFTKGTVITEYAYKCRAGQALGGIVESP